MCGLIDYFRVIIPCYNNIVSFSRFYAEKLWPTIESVYMKSVKKILDKYAKIVGVDIEPAKLEKTAKEIAHFERTMANQLMTGSEELRRNFTRMYNPVVVSTEQRRKRQLIG